MRSLFSWNGLKVYDARIKYNNKQSLKTVQVQENKINQDNRTDTH